MNNAKIENAVLDRYRGPFFPEALVELHQILYGDSPLRFNGLEFSEEMNKRGNIDGQCLVGKLKSTDDYLWSWCVFFITPRHTILIALPWSNDGEVSGGTSSDRHSALYMRGAVISSKDIEDAIRMLRMFIETAGAQVEKVKASA